MHPISPEQIERLQELNDAHGGIRCVESILHMLRGGYLESALACRRNEGDKTRQYPDVEEHLHQMFGCRSHGVKECDDWLCKPIRDRRLQELGMTQGS